MYRLACKNPLIKEIYIGHTKNIKIRLKRHKQDCKNSNRPNHNIKLYTFIRENGGWDNWIMIPFEEFERDTDEEACQHEQFWIDLTFPELNTNAAYRSEEYKRETNRESTIRWRKNNAEKYKEQYQKRFNTVINCKLCGKQMNYSSLCRHNKTFHKNNSA